MKKYFLNFGLMGAIALASSVGFTACSDDKDDPNASGNEVSQVVEDAPEVNVDFVFNVSTESGASTRMTSANTQAATTETFRGIQNANVMAFHLAADGNNVASAVVANKDYDLGTIATAGSLSATNSRRVIELSLPESTNTLMFWGKAIKNGTSDQQGAVSWHVEKDLNNIAFGLERRIPASNSAANGETAFNQYRKVLAAVLNKIVQTSINVPTTAPITYGTDTWYGSLAWSDYATVTGETLSTKTTDPSKSSDSMSPLGEILANAFVTLNTIYGAEVRAGSGPALARMLGDLYNVIHSVATATPTNIKERVAQQVAQAIQDNITSVINDPGGSPTWNTTTSNIVTFSGVADAALVTGNINDFPRVLFNVPAGATVLKYTTSTNTYEYNNAIPTYSMSGEAGGSFDPKTYCYPAELCYFGNSPIRVTNDEHVTADYPQTTTDWDNDGNTAWDGWTKGGHVLSSTRSVAMQNNINYGTAMLKTTVEYSATTLNDNNHKIQNDRKGVDEPNNTFTVAEGLFTLTGILVGGVEPEVGWNYLAKAASPTYSAFIYDNDLPNTAIPASGQSTPNYTLLWDNWNEAQKNNKQNVVYVALEFVNNTGKDFWGMNNLIRNGGTFYITGKMDPDAGLSTTDRSAGITWPTNYALPPYDANGATIKERRIFIQDFVTTANFKFGANSLQSALISVPDLRSTQITLGLSVDLSWSTGLNFTPTLGE